MAFTQADLDAISLNQWEVEFNDISLGYLVDDTLRAGVEAMYTRVENVNQFVGVIKMWNRATMPNIEFSVFGNSPDYLRSRLMAGQVETVGFNDGSVQIGMGVKTRPSTEFEGALRIKPYPATSDSYKNEILIPRCVVNINFDSIISGKQDTPVEIPVSITALPDTTQPIGFEYGVIGNTQIDKDQPLVIAINQYRYGISGSSKAGLLAATFQPLQAERLNCTLYYGTPGTSDNIAAVSGGDITLTTTSVASEYSVGDFAQITQSGNKYYAYVTAVNTTTGVISVVYEALGSATVTPSTVTNDTIAVLNNVVSDIARDKVTWSSVTSSGGSTASTIVTVGDTYGGAGTTNKGVVFHTNTGSGTAYVKATFTPEGGIAVSSEELVITAS